MTAFLFFTVIVYQSSLWFVEGRNEMEYSSALVRYTQIERSYYNIKSSPFIGYGPGNAATIVGVKNKQSNYTLDNYLLTLGIESGLPALFCFLIFIINILLLCYRSIKNDFFFTSILISLVSFLITLTVLSLKVNIIYLFLFSAIALILNDLNYREKINEL